MSELIEVEQDEVIAVVDGLFEFFQTNGISELLAYMAMIHIAHALEEKHGFGNERKQDA